MSLLRKIGLVTLKEFNSEKEICQRIIEDTDKKYKDKLANVIRNYETIEADLTERIDNQSETISTLKAELKSAECSKGGLTKKINELKKENEELKKEFKDLKKKLEESMTDKYLVKKVRGGRTPNTQQMKVRHTGVESRIIKKMKED